MSQSTNILDASDIHHYNHAPTNEVKILRTNEVKILRPPPHMPQEQQPPQPKQQPGVVTNMEVMSQPKDKPQQEPEIMTVQRTVSPFE